MKGLILKLGTADITGDLIPVGTYQYQVSVQINGRFLITIYQDGKKPYIIAGDKKTKHDSYALLNQIESIVFNHAPDNWHIKEIVDKYWPTDKEKTKKLRAKKNFERYMEYRMNIESEN